jgi:HEAT repeat protein
MEGSEAALVLRLKARIGDEEPQVAGQVFDALLSIEGERALPLVAEYLDNGGSAVREEAALALGSSRLPSGWPLLQKAYAGARDFQFREVLLRAISLTRQQAAIEWLLGLVRTARRRDAIDAIHALALHCTSDEIRRETARGGWPRNGAPIRISQGV